jgi:hypothetical protein
MTIGLAVTGENAGLAAFRALEAVEKVARGAIRGFVSFVVITEDGRLLRAQTQRGGTATLFVEGETTGAAPPDDIAQARFAALMSSGPDRPEPLAQFTPGDAACGLVTGHRLPNVPGEGSDVPLNIEVLDRLRAGAAPAAAIEAAFAAYPTADAGLIVLDRQGRLFAADSPFVQSRGDLGFAFLEDEARNHRVAVLHNAIHPKDGLAALAAGTAMDCMAPFDQSDLFLTLAAGTPVALGPTAALHTDRTGRVLEVTVTRRAWLSGRRDGARVNIATPVLDGGRLIGHTTTDPYCIVEAGRLVSISGQHEVQIGVRRST